MYDAIIRESLLCRQAFDVMRKQEQTRLAELDVEKVHYEAIQSQVDVVSDKALYFVPP